MARAEAFCCRIDAVNQWTGKIVSMLFFPMVVIVTLEVGHGTLTYNWRRQ